MIGTHLHALWNDLWPNTVAPSLWTLLAVLASHVKAARQRERHRDEALREAQAGRRIAADLFEHHTGRAHPDAPGKESGME